MRVVKANYASSLNRFSPVENYFLLTVALISRKGLNGIRDKMNH